MISFLPLRNSKCVLTQQENKTHAEEFFFFFCLSGWKHSCVSRCHWLLKWKANAVISTPNSTKELDSSAVCHLCRRHCSALVYSVLDICDHVPATWYCGTVPTAYVSMYVESHFSLCIALTSGVWQQVIQACCRKIWRLQEGPGSSQGPQIFPMRSWVWSCGPHRDHRSLPWDAWLASCSLPTRKTSWRLVSLL